MSTQDPPNPDESDPNVSQLPVVGVQDSPARMGYPQPPQIERRGHKFGLSRHFKRKPKVLHTRSGKWLQRRFFAISGRPHSELALEIFSSQEVPFAQVGRASLTHEQIRHDDTGLSD